MQEIEIDLNNNTLCLYYEGGIEKGEFCYDYGDYSYTSDCYSTDITISKILITNHRQQKNYIIPFHSLNQHNQSLITDSLQDRLIEAD